MASSPSRTTHIKLTSLAPAMASSSSKISSSLSSTRRICMGLVFIIVISFRILALAKRDDKFRAAPVARLYPGAAAVPLGYLPHDSKPCACSLYLSSYRALKKLKDALRMFRRDPGTAVANSDTGDRRARPLRPIGPDLHIRRFAVAGKLEGVCNEVVDRLGRPCPVYSKTMEVLRYADLRVRNADLAFETLQRLDHDRLAVDFLSGRAHPLGAGERQDIVEQAIQSLRSLNHTP